MTKAFRTVRSAGTARCFRDGPRASRIRSGQAWTSKELVACLDRAVARGEPVALVTVIGTAGSAPRELGAKMLVHPSGDVEGTIGGGVLEALATQEAVLALACGKPRRARFNLGYSGPRSIGMFCGGEVEVFVDVIRRSMRLLILGGGHVGQALAKVAEALGIPHGVADDRASFATADRFPDANPLLVGPLPESIDELGVDGETCVVIVTRCHMQDLECLAKILQTPAAYIGMIGSVTKVRQVYRRLGQRGIDPAADPRVHAPVGLALGSSDPGHIAISVLAEILKFKNGASGDSLKDRVPVKKKEPRLPVVPAVCAAPGPRMAKRVTKV